MLTLTLVRNQSTPRRYVRFVRYERRGNVVTPLLDTGNGICVLPWSRIRGDHADPELERAWRRHVRQVPRGEVLEEHNERAWTEYVRSLPPEARSYEAP